MFVFTFYNKLPSSKLTALVFGIDANVVCVCTAEQSRVGQVLELGVSAGAFVHVIGVSVRRRGVGLLRDAPRGREQCPLLLL